MTRVPGRRVAAIAVALISVSACGIPTDEDARRIDPEEIPPGLLDVSAPTTVAGALDPLGTTEVVAVYLIRDGALAPSLAEIRRGASLNDVIELIRVAPSEELAEEGFRSALVSDVPVVQSISLARGVADIDLGPAFLELPSNDQVLALGQLVLTATARPGVGQVRFTLEGLPVQVPTADGTIASDTLSRDDYLALLPSEEAAPTTTTT
ncbi:MAG: GerMN domain-containing protein [Acidimicrobiia bacterium]